MLSLLLQSFQGICKCLLEDCHVEAEVSVSFSHHVTVVAWEFQRKTVVHDVGDPEEHMAVFHL